MKRILCLFIAIITIFCITGCSQTASLQEIPEDFSFSVEFAHSSYNSKTGKLIKSLHTTDVDKYTTTYLMSENELKKIYKLIQELNIEKYDSKLNTSDFETAIPPS